MSAINKSFRLIKEHKIVHFADDAFCMCVCMIYNRCMMKTNLTNIILTFLTNKNPSLPSRKKHTTYLFYVKLSIVYRARITWSLTWQVVVVFDPSLTCTSCRTSLPAPKQRVLGAFRGGSFTRQT